MNNWIEQNKEKFSSGTNEFGESGYIEALPVYKLKQLFSKSGEELAREMCIKIYDICFEGRVIKDYTEDDFHANWEEAFLEAYNIQEVKIASLRTDLEKANNLFNSIKIPFDVDEMRSNYARMAEENGQMLVNCANWKRELAAKDAENEALKKERDAYYAELHAKRIEVEELRGLLTYGIGYTDYSKGGT